MKRLLARTRTRAAAFLHDLMMIPVAWLGAYWLRFNLDLIQPEHLWFPVRQLPVVLLIQGGMFWYFGLYRGAWRFASMPDLLRIIKAVLAGIAITAAALFLINRLEFIPRSIFALDAILLILLLGGSRFLYRIVKDRRHYGQTVTNVLIVGAGRAGEMLVRDLLRDTARLLRPVAFVDDSHSRQGMDIHGVQVAGSCEDIPALVGRLDVQLILIAVSAVTSRQMQRIVSLCEAAGVQFRILPKMQDLVSGQVSVSDLREVKIDDLLGRDAVSLDWQSIVRGVEGKTVLVSGGGGSIGSELCRQIARLKPAQLVVFDLSEFNLYNIELELRRDFPDLKLTAVLGDVRDRVAVERVVSRARPQIVFHAAAYKHVPMLEQQARAAVLNNVFGTRTLAMAADQHGCATFVMISTDKAVNPANIMGMSKRVAEIYCQNLNTRSKTHFITVRFGNVLGSAGSVIPLFQKQIADGGPVTVTHPEITRYFMTIPEAAQLILQAGAMGQGGEIFVLDMGEPIKIAYLAEQLILLSGRKPGEDIEIKYTGLRPGEKLYEELFHESEKLAGTRHPKILLANSRMMDIAELERLLDRLEEACAANDDERIYAMLCQLVPEHQSTPCVETGGETTREAVIYPWKGSPRNDG